MIKNKSMEVFAMQRIVKLTAALAFVGFQCTHTARPADRRLSITFDIDGNNQLSSAFIYLNNEHESVLIFLSDIISRNKVKITGTKGPQRIDKKIKDPAFMNNAQSILLSIPPALFAQQLNQMGPNKWDLPNMTVMPGTWQEKMYNLVSKEVENALADNLPQWTEWDNVKAIFGWYALKNMGSSLYKKAFGS
jgi:hypothetical protein